MEDQFFQQHIPSFSSRKFYHPWQHIITARNNSNLFLFISRFKYYDCVDFFIPEKGKRLSFCNNRRRTQRHDLLVKI